MSWPCFMVERQMGRPIYHLEGSITIPAQYYVGSDRVAFDALKPGAMFFVEHFWSNNAPSLFVRLPNGVTFCIDGSGKNGSRWRRDGEAPSITVSPSINIEGVYHGWIQDGVVSDDVEGRKFDEAGRFIPSQASTPEAVENS